MKISAVIFDLNGTILEDEDEYGKAFGNVLKSLGVEVKIPFPQVRGIGVKENWLSLIKKYDIKTESSPEELTNKTQEEYLLQINDVTIRPGFLEFVNALIDSGIQIALATSNNWDVTDKILDKVGLQGIFNAVTTVEEVAFSKPDPAIFILTADKLGVEREECLVIEDAASGVTAAREAGMKVIVISDKVEDEEDFSGADLVVESFADITPKIIEGL
jgi:HAD superfamily hydrolase (TIGR01509 family)